MDLTKHLIPGKRGRENSLQALRGKKQNGEEEKHSMMIKIKRRMVLNIPAESGSINVGIKEGSLSCSPRKKVHHIFPICESPRSPTR